MKTGVSYFGNRMLDHYRNVDLPEIANGNFDYVVHTFSENDLYYYSDTIASMIEESHWAGLSVYIDPWGVGGLFAGEAFSDFLLKNPIAWQETADGSKIPIACPNNPEFRAFIQSWLNVAVSMAPDVIFWDDPHLYVPLQGIHQSGDWTCHCTYCKEAFLSAYNRQLPSLIDAEVIEFRQNTIVNFIRFGSAIAARHNVQNALGLLPFEDPEHTIFQWGKIAEISDIDIIAVSPFWQVFGANRNEFVSKWSERIVQICKASGKEPMVWLQAFLVEAGHEDEIKGAVEIAYDTGVRNFAVWGFRGCSHMSKIRCERPEIMWQVVKDILIDVKTRG